MDLLIPLAIHSYDIITTKKLLCTCKFDSIDIWKLKFVYEFPETKYINFHSNDELINSYINYYIRKTDNFYILLKESTTSPIFGIYEYSLSNAEIVNVANSLSSTFNIHFVKFTIRNRFILLERFDDNNSCRSDHTYTQVGSFSTFAESENARQMIFENMKTSKPFKNRFLRFSHLIVDLKNVNIIFNNRIYERHPPINNESKYTYTEMWN